MRKVSFEFKNIDETDLKNLLESLVKCLKGNEIFLLIGNLGAGKTTFVKYLVSFIDEDLKDEVNSPTFVVMNVYETKNFNIYHIDLYRVKDFDLTDIVGNGLIFIEWAEIKEFEGLNLPVITVNLEIGKDINRRNIKIEISNGNYLKRCLDNLGDRR
ncbi:MAG: tRNA (adenosine(37)-N6)-threonylcarbamoyltransferase complex ATPase subunit type 1 TsaE [Persephonella sp.]|nr:MAG: tRNA (adenosine(37)-N6)-threonylcarbamoyltransferase complex ATPase subunit type 1 TsaE [Persephonella sp.]